MYYVHNTLELNYVFMPVPGPKAAQRAAVRPFFCMRRRPGPFFERVLAQNRIGKGDAAALRTFTAPYPRWPSPRWLRRHTPWHASWYGAHDPARVVTARWLPP